MMRSLRTRRNDVLYEVVEVRTTVKEVDRQYDSKRQEVELKVLPLSTRRFKYIIEVALKLLFGLRNPSTTILGMTPYNAIVQQ